LHCKKNCPVHGESVAHLSSFYPKQGLKIGECSFPSQIEIGISLGINVRNAH
jgi:hypothetical protein